MALQPPSLDKVNHSLNASIEKNSNPNTKMATPQTKTASPSVRDQSAAQQLQYAAGNGAQFIPPRAEGYRPAVIRESRIKDRPYKPASDSLSIKIELDLEVEVDLYARVKGDVTIGLM